MGRANRLTVDQGIFHVTHRCHNRSFLLRFAKDRNGYRRKLLEALREFSVCLFDYTITCNHIHLLLEVSDKAQLSGFMRKVAGEFARSYNRRKKRSNAVWGDNFHATLVQDGRYLMECLLYIELNMVRCGVVEHPKDWTWVGYHEIMGQRQRYRLLDLERLCWRLQAPSLADLRKQIEETLERRIAQGEVKRMACWTEALGVGSRPFLEESQKLIFTRLESTIAQGDGGLCVLKEEPPAYGNKTTPKSDPKDVSAR